VTENRNFDPRQTLNTFRTRVPGPIGCLLLVVLSPLLLIGLLIGAFVLRRKTRELRRNFARTPRTPEELSREVALCSLVRGLTLDAHFSREQALSTPVMTGDAGAPPTVELLDEALRRGWLTGDAERMSVTAEGRAEAERFLDRAGL
jgi:hypothetical protein